MTKLFVICMAFLYMMLPGVSAAGSLTDNGNGTVSDSGTLLMWQQGETSAMTWEAALSYCEGLTLAAQTDWRLPNIKELSSIVEDRYSSPAINTMFFPDLLRPSDDKSNFQSRYWSSTAYASITSAAWSVDFFDGDFGYTYKTNTSYVRCVRGGQ